MTELLDNSTASPPNGTEDPISAYNYPDLAQLVIVQHIFILLYLLVMVLAAIGNGAVCFTVIRSKKMQTPVNFYIFNLSVCDLVVGIFVVPFKMMELLAPAEWIELTGPSCTVALFLQAIFVFASVLTLVAICLERYVNPSTPFRLE